MFEKGNENPRYMLDARKREEAQLLTNIRDLSDTQLIELATTTSEPYLYQLLADEIYKRTRGQSENTNSIESI